MFGLFTRGRAVPPYSGKVVRLLKPGFFGRRSVLAIVALFSVLTFTCSCLSNQESIVYLAPTCLKVIASDQEEFLQGNSGSCVPYKYLGNNTYLGLTCKHVVKDRSAKESKAKPYIKLILPLMTKKYLAEDSFVVIKAEVSYISEKYDIATIKFSTTERIVLAVTSNASRLKTYTPVYQLGYPGDMFLTRTIGETQYIHRTGLWVATCSTLPGVSGGGVFDITTNELIGISAGVFLHSNYAGFDKSYTTYCVLFIPLYDLKLELSL